MLRWTCRHQLIEKSRCCQVDRPRQKVNESRMPKFQADGRCNFLHRRFRGLCGLASSTTRRSGGSGLVSRPATVAAAEHPPRQTLRYSAPMSSNTITERKTAGDLRLRRMIANILKLESEHNPLTPLAEPPWGRGWLRDARASNRLVRR
jgi:hypothetical protein